MRKTILTLSVFVISLTTVKAQTYIKSNALYLLGGIPNVSLETRLGTNTTYNFNAVFSPWQSINGRPYRFWQFINEGRYYFREANNGFYAGGYAAVDAYKLSKWDHPSTDVQHGWGISLGAVAGYQLPFSNRWLMDFYFAGGWHHGWYWGEDKLTGGMYKEWNKSGEWIPYQIGAAFAYRLSKKK